MIRSYMYSLKVDDQTERVDKIQNEWFFKHESISVDC